MREPYREHSEQCLLPSLCAAQVSRTLTSCHTPLNQLPTSYLLGFIPEGSLNVQVLAASLFLGRRHFCCDHFPNSSVSSAPRRPLAARRPPLRALSAVASRALAAASSLLASPLLSILVRCHVGLSLGTGRQHNYSVCVN